METNAMSLFEYGETRVRIVMLNQEPWFVAKDVCDVLQHVNSRRAVSRLDEDEKGVTSVNTPGGPQEMAIVNESGLYALILTSRKPEAKAFKRWVTHSVLPQIRTNGKYQVSERPTLPETYLEALEALISAEREKQQMQNRVQALTPKAEAYDVLLSGKNAQTMAQVAKAFGTGRNRLFTMLRQRRILMSNNLPYQEYLERGYFSVRQVPTAQGTRGVVNVTQTLVTAKGIDFMRRLLNEAELRMTI